MKHYLVGLESCDGNRDHKQIPVRAESVKDAINEVAFDMIRHATYDGDYEHRASVKVENEYIILSFDGEKSKVKVISAEVINPESFTINND